MSDTIREPGAAATSPAFDQLRTRLIESGRWRPDWNKSGIAAFYEALTRFETPMPSPDEEAPLAPAEWFARFLEELPPLVDLGESAPHGATPAANIDPASLALHHRVLRHMEANPGVDYAEALTACADR